MVDSDPVTAHRLPSSVPLRIVPWILQAFGVIWTVITKGQYCLPIFAGAASDVLSSLDPYVIRDGRPDFFKYHPIWGYLLAPLLIFPDPIKPWVWAGVGAASFQIAFSLLYREIFGIREGSASDRIRFIGFCCVFPLALSDGFYGQINSLLLLLLTIGVAWFSPSGESRSQQWILGGLSLVLAVLMKLFPVGLLLPLFFLSKPSRSRWFWFPFFLILLQFGLLIFQPSSREWMNSWIEVLRRDSQVPHLKIGWMALIQPHFTLEFARSLWLGSGIVSAVFFAFALLRSQDRRELLFPAIAWVLCAVLVFSHMTEPPTMVLLTPAWLVLFRSFPESSWTRKTLMILIWICVVALPSRILSVDVRSAMGGDHALKTIGLLLSFLLLSRDLLRLARTVSHRT